MEVQLEKPKHTKPVLIYGQKGQAFSYPTKPLKITIVGADGRKWTKEQEVKTKNVIYDIIRDACEKILGKPVVIQERQLHDMVRKISKNEKSVIVWDDEYRRMLATKEKKSPFIFSQTVSWMKILEELTIVSGHCPVGEERWYDYAFDKWMPRNYSKISEEWQKQGLKLIKVYNQGGVDTWVEIIATKLGIKTQIYPAPAMQWEDKKDIPIELKTSPVEHFINGLKNIRYSPLPNVDMIADLMGYKSRNIVAANVCDILFDIEPKGSCKYCKGTGENEISKIPQDKNRFIRKEDEKSYFVKCYYCEGDGAYSGGTWTLKYARKLGKEVHKVIIE